MLYGHHSADGTYLSALIGELTERIVVRHEMLHAIIKPEHVKQMKEMGEYWRFQRCITGMGLEEMASRAKITDVADFVLLQL